jgi:hypothetical protein
LDTTIAVRRWSGGTTDTGIRKVWLPSAANFSTEYANTDDENGVFDYFTINSDKSYRIAYKETNLSEAVYYWTRSAVGGTHPLWRSVGPNGSVYGANYWDNRAIRPVINVYSNNYLEKVSEGVYRMIGGGAA